MLLSGNKSTNKGLKMSIWRWKIFYIFYQWWLLELIQWWINVISTKNKKWRNKQKKPIILKCLVLHLRHCQHVFTIKQESGFRGRNLLNWSRRGLDEGSNEKRTREGTTALVQVCRESRQTEMIAVQRQEERKPHAVDCSGTRLHVLVSSVSTSKEPDD